MQERGHSLVEAEEFRLLDKEGNMRASLSTWEANGLPMLQLYDEELRPRLVVSIDGPSSPMVALLHSTGKVAANMRVFEDGRVALTVRREDGSPVFEAFVDINMEGCVKMHDSLVE